MGTGTIADWEARRFEAEAATEIAAIPTVERPAIEREIDAPDVVALKGRMTAGIAVQLLWARDTGATFVSVTVADRSQTFEVAPADALDAFAHPFVYGCTIALTR